MDVAIHTLAPGVQQHDHPWLATKVFFEHAVEYLVDGTKEDPDDEGLIRQDQRIEFMREREHQMQGLDRKLYREHPLPPILSVVRSAGGAMPIVAGLIPKGILAAVTAMKGLASEFRRAAIDQPVQHALLVRGEPAGIILDGFFDVIPQHIANGQRNEFGDTRDLSSGVRLLRLNQHDAGQMNVELVRHIAVIGSQAKPVAHCACHELV